MRITEVDQPVSQAQLDALEKVLDHVFGKIGIDVEFTRHFLDRVNDERNYKQITISELALMFKKEFQKWGKPIAQLGPDAEAVMKDLSSDINIPFALDWNRDSGMLELVAKTVMRKKNFRTPNKEFPVEQVKENVLIVEGGSMPGVGAIHHSEIMPTLAKLEKELGVNLRDFTLGSVGKKEFSGDIDIAINLDPEQLPEFAKKLEAAPSIQAVTKSSVFMTVVDIVDYDADKSKPGVQRTGKVQIDFMPGDPGWMKTYYHSPHEKGMSDDGRHSKYKGVFRNIMIASIAAHKDPLASDEKIDDGRPVKLERFMWSPSDGLIRVERTPVPKKSGQGYTKKNKNVIKQGPWKTADEIAEVLGLGSAEVLYSFETLFDAVKKNFELSVQKKIFQDFARNNVVQDIGVPEEVLEYV
jgi:hypothetical protein